MTIAKRPCGAKSSMFAQSRNEVVLYVEKPVSPRNGDRLSLC